jgi:hypothetical protein
MLTELALIFGAIALGGLLKGATGAGAPVVAVPVLALFFDVQLAVAVMVMPNLLSNLGQAWAYRRALLEPRFTWTFALTGAVGVGLGTVLLATVEPRYLMLAVALAVFLFIGFRLARPDWGLGFAAARRIVAPVGLAAGALQGATGISAPVSLTFLNAMRLPRENFVATVSVFFAVITAVQVPVMWGYGLLDGRRLLYSLAAIVPLMALMPVGARLARLVPARVFDRLILVLLGVIAARLAWQALG